MKSILTGSLRVFIMLLLFACLTDTSASDILKVGIPKSSVPKDSLRFVIRHLTTKDAEFSNLTIINFKGKVIRTFDDCYMMRQGINCLNFPGARLYVFSQENQKFYSVDRNGLSVDLSLKYKYVEDMGEGFVVLYPVDKNDGYEIINKNGQLILKDKDISRWTRFVRGNALLKRNENWEIIDSTGKTNFTFDDWVDLNDMVYVGNQHDGFIRVKDGRGSYFYVDAFGKTILDLTEVLPRIPIKNAGMICDGICMVKYNEAGKQNETFAYIDTTGNIIWKSTNETGLGTGNFKNGVALIKYDGADPEKLWEEAQKNGKKSYSVPVASKYINKEGQEITNQDQKLNIWYTKGHLALVATSLQTLDNRMNGFGIYDLHKKKFVFTSEWPINYFDEHIIIVNDNKVYQRENDTASETLRIYNYKKKIVWKAM
jgi:hypothetical protein